MRVDRQNVDFLPSKRKAFLAEAIGRRIVEIRRLFALDRVVFLEDDRYTEADYFSYNAGPVQIDFDNGLTHVLDVWGEQLSVVAAAEPLVGDEAASLYRLSELEPTHEALKECLGATCRDVRIWVLKEEFESEEAKEAAISYVLAGGRELFYCIYFHEDLDSDYLLVDFDIPREKVARCISLASAL